MGADTQVFRFSCELFEEVKEDVLQSAVEEALEIFDVFHVIMRRGIFWYYLEKTDIMPIVKEEYKTPCAPLYYRYKENLLFEVTYYNCRINLEVYHVLSDGTGAMRFLNTIVALYLKNAHNIKEVLPEYDASKTQMEDDSFYRYYLKHKSYREKANTAYKIRSSVLPEDRMNIIIGHVSTSELLQAAHKCNTTMTAFIGACLIDAIGENMPNNAKKKDIILSIPVNLRKYFPSQSASNFFSLIFTGYNFNNSGNSFESIISKINADFHEKLDSEKLFKNINAYSDVEHNFIAKIVPLGIKDFFLRKAYILSQRKSTATLSNIGIIKMPKELTNYIKAYDVFTGTNKLQICMCSYLDTLSISFTTPFTDTDIERLFFRKLTSFGINCELYTNNLGEK